MLNKAWLRPQAHAPAVLTLPDAQNASSCTLSHTLTGCGGLVHGCGGLGPSLSCRPSLLSIWNRAAAIMPVVAAAAGTAAGSCWVRRAAMAAAGMGTRGSGITGTGLAAAAVASA